MINTPSLASCAEVRMVVSGYRLEPRRAGPFRLICGAMVPECSAEMAPARGAAARAVSVRARGVRLCMLALLAAGRRGGGMLEQLCN